MIEESGLMTTPSSALSEASPPTVPATVDGTGLRPLPTAGANGTSLVAPSRLPKARRKSRMRRLVFPAVILVAVAGGVGAWYYGARGPQVRADLVTAVLELKDLQLKVVERGTLEAKENHDVKCEVKTGSRGAPKIKWVVENGTYVKKDELLVEI